MKVFVNFPDTETPYIDLPTDNINFFIRLYPEVNHNGIYNFKAWDGIDSQDKQLPFKVNEKLRGIFYIKNIKS